MSLAACSFGNKKAYTVTGLSSDAALQTQLQSLIDERFSLDDFEEDERIYKEQLVAEDVEKFMRARGYYMAKVSIAQEDERKASYQIDAGQRVMISQITAQPAQYQSEIDALNLKPGDALDADKVLAAQGKLYKSLQAKSCAFDLSIEHKVYLNPKTQKAQVYFVIDQGAPAKLGEVSFTGELRSKEAYLRNFIPWQVGDCFEHKQVEALRAALLNTDLFEKAEMIFPKNAQEGGTLPIEVMLTRRAQRSILAGLSYYTNEGLGTVLGWEHRNLFGQGERLKSSLTLSELEQSLDVKVTKPFFFRRNQSFTYEGSLLREENDAYAQTGLRTGVSVKRQFTTEVSARLGTEFLLSRIDEEAYGTDENYALVAPYISATYDSRDSPLDPHKGWLITSTLQPYFDVFSETDPFLKAQASAHSYLAVHDRVVLAGRLHMGAITGTSQSSVPATERFYAGGGGSVRGFGYQEIGPFDGNDPIGGRSLTEASFETRFKVTDTLGFVTFLDTGYVSDETISDFKSLSIGTGAGLRYFTDFGPLRFDVGTPISGDENADQNIQFYISIGQAF